MLRNVDLLRQLSDAGIARRHLLRIDAELRDHYEDLKREANATCDSPIEAAAEARRRLGADADIAAEFLAYPELRCWSYRWPVTRFALGLVVLLLIVLLAPLRCLSARRAAIVRFGTAALASSAILAALMLGMQSVVHMETTGNFARTFDVNRVPQAIREFERLPRETELPRFARRIREAPDAPDLRDATDWFGQARANASFADLGFGLPDGDYLPILKVAPTYPSAALARGLEGSVIIEFTVARSGAVKDVVVVESTDSVFEQAAVEAAYRFKYRPRVVRGQAVEVSGVRNRITFDFPV